MFACHLRTFLSHPPVDEREIQLPGHSFTQTFPAQFSKQNRFFVLPTIDRGGLLVIPPRQIQPLYGLPEDVLDVTTTGNNTIQTRWTVWDDEVAENNFQMNVIRNQITRNLNVLTPPIAEELAKGFDREWGTDKENWRSISVWTSALRLIAGAANGAFIGPPLCKLLLLLGLLEVLLCPPFVRLHQCVLLGSFSAQILLQVVSGFFLADVYFVFI